MKAIQPSLTETLLDAVASATGNSDAFALPARATQLDWQSSFASAPASITLQLQVSLDNLIWSTIDSSTATAGEDKTINTSAQFVRVRINAISGGSGITVKINAKTGFIGSTDVTTNDLHVLGNLIVDGTSLLTGAVTTGGDLTVGNDLTVVGALVADGLSYPTSDGTSGQVIGTDGAGNLSFIDIIHTFPFIEVGTTPYASSGAVKLGASDVIMQRNAANTGDVPVANITSPTQIAGLALWLDASDATTINAGSPSDGDPVSLWADKSGNGYDATQNGVNQIETATVVETVPGTLTAGDASVVVTADGMMNSPKTIAVAVATNDDAATVAGKIRAALAADVDVSAFFTVDGTGADVVLTTIAPASNDATMNIATADGTCSGLASEPTSADTGTGYAALEVQPVYKTNIQDGLPVIRFTSSPTPNFMGLSALAWLNSQPGISIAGAVRSAGGQIFAVLTNANAARRAFFETQINSGYISDVNMGASNEDATDAITVLADSFGSDTAVAVATSAVVVANVSTMEATISVSAADFNSVNGVGSIKAGTPGNFPNTDASAIHIGGQNIEPGPAVLDGDVCELVVFTRPLTMRERRQLLEYLSAKWGTP